MTCSTTRSATSLCGVNRKSAAFYFLRLREIIAYKLEAECEAMFGVLDAFLVCDDGLYNSSIIYQH